MTQQNLQRTATYCKTLQHTTTHCNTLQHSLTHCTLFNILKIQCNRRLQHNTTCCNTLQHTTTHSNLLPHSAHTATHRNALQHIIVHPRHDADWVNYPVSLFFFLPVFLPSIFGVHVYKLILFSSHKSTNMLHKLPESWQHPCMGHR